MTEAAPEVEATSPALTLREKSIHAALRSVPFSVVYAYYLLLAAWCFRPVLGQLQEAFIGKVGSDVLRNAWGFWWFKAMLLERFAIPAFTVYLNYPRGMLILLIDPLNCLLSIPLQLIFGLPAAYNLYLIAVVAFNAFSACLLARHIVQSWGPSLIAGALYGFAPFVLSNSLSGNSEVVNVGWIPLFLLFFHRALAGGARKDGLLAGLMLICATLSSWYYGYISGVFAALYALVYWIIRAARRQELGPSIKAVAWMGLLFLAFSALMVAIYHDIIPSVQKGIARGGRGQDQLTVLAGNAVSLWDMYAPTPERWHRPSLYHFPIEVWLALPFALLLGIRRAWSWALMGILALLLSLSYKTQWHPAEFPTWLWQPWEMVARSSAVAYDLFLKIPFAHAVRFPSRFLSVANLMFGIILASGLRTICVDRQVLRPIWVGLGVVGSLWLTTLVVHSARFHEILSVTPVPTPKYVQEIASDPDFVAIVNLPTDLSGGMQLYYQSVHEKPLLNFVDFVTSRIYYLPAKQIPLSYSSVIYGMHLRGYDPYLEDYPSEVPAWPDSKTRTRELTRLKEAGLRYIVVERDKYRPESLEEFETLMEPLVELRMREDGVDLYRLK